MAASTAASVSLRSRPLNLHRSLATPTIKSQSVVSFSGVGSKQRFARLRVSCAPETVEKVCKIVKKQLALPEDSKVVGESKFGDLGADSLDTLCSCNCFDVYKELVPYEKAWAWQKSIVDERKASIKRNEDCPETLIVLQHHPVYTMGTGSSEEFLNFDIKDSPFEVYRTERGGEVTFHGPGQLVLYPIINLRNHKMDLHWYLRTLEEVVIRALDKSFSIKASRIEGLTGVWVGNQKVAAMGIKVTQWIAYHGLALNVSTDLTWFNRIVPCGIRDRQVGSVKGILSESWPSTNHRCANLHDLDDSRLINTARQSLITEFSEIFQLKIHHKPVSELEI